jgi:hypothetical protein
MSHFDIKPDPLPWSLRFLLVILALELATVIAAAGGWL